MGPASGQRYRTRSEEGVESHPANKKLGKMVSSGGSLQEAQDGGGGGSKEEA
jgi:hypothetical protein